MRTLMIWSLMATMLIALGFPIAPVSANHAPGLVAPTGNLSGQEDGDDDETESETDDEGDEGEREDEDQDHVDDGEKDKPGRGDDKKKDKDKPDRDEDEEADNTDETNPVVGVTGGYTVETECEFDDGDNTTECEFSGIAPDGASDIGRLTVPTDAVCTEVLDGEFVFIDLTSGASVPGYASEEDELEFELELQGKVTTAGTMTYWVSTTGGLFPAEGPALRCDPPVFTLTSAPTTPPDVTTGTLVVATYACDNVPADTSAFDWFGQCASGSGPLGFTLTPVGANTAEQHAAESDGAGKAMFETIEPGTYELVSVDASWCHAKSDRVNAEGEVVIRAGVQATVWAFYCDAGKG